MIKKITLTAFLTLCALFVSASAQTQIAPEKKAAISELANIISSDNRLDELAGQMSLQLEKLHEATVEELLAAHPELSAADKKRVRDSLLKDTTAVSRAFQARLREKLKLNDVMGEILIAVYDKYYTLNELKDIIAFYKTPTGQKTLKLTSPILAETIQLLSERLLPKIPIILKEIEDEDRQEIEKNINAAQPSKGKVLR